MTIRVIKYKEKEDEPVVVIAEFENATRLDTEYFPRITFMSVDLKYVVEMIVPSDCYISVERGVKGDR